MKTMTRQADLGCESSCYKTCFLSKSRPVDFVVNPHLEPGFKEELMEDVRIGCEEFGTIDKITIFDKNPDGIVLVRFRSASAAQNV